MILESTSTSLRVVSDATATTAEPIWTASYIDRSGTTLTPGGSDGVLSGTSPVTVVGAPASSTLREVHSLTVYNADTVAHAVTVEKLASSSRRTIALPTLEVGESLLYNRSAGWVVLNRAGAPKAAGVTVVSSQFLGGPWRAANLTTTVNLSTNATFVLWMGTSPRSSTSISVRYRVTTAAVTVTWGELAVYRGSVNLGGNAALTLLGWADIASVLTSVGQKTSTVSLSTAARPGDDLWIGIGNSATTVAAIRAGLADDLQSGIYCIQSSYRPSTDGSGTFSLAGPTTVLPWLNVYVN